MSAEGLRKKKNHELFSTAGIFSDFLRDIDMDANDSNMSLGEKKKCVGDAFNLLNSIKIMGTIHELLEILEKINKDNRTNYDQAGSKNPVPHTKRTIQELEHEVEILGTSNTSNSDSHLTPKRKKRDYKTTSPKYNDIRAAGRGYVKLLEYYSRKAKNTVEYSQIDRKTYAEIALSSLTIGKVLKHIKFLKDDYTHIANEEAKVNNQSCLPASSGPLSNESTENVGTLSSGYIDMSGLDDFESIYDLYNQLENSM